VQLHPVPLIETSVSPPGTVSVTVTVPVVGPAPLLVTVTVYAAPVCPCVKLPLCVEVTLSTGAAVTTVESVPIDIAEPPPDTLTEFISGDPALAATFTVTAIAG
jgi:hypothetical protein